MTNQRPYLSHYTDKTGRTRWRFRRRGLQKELSGAPGQERFEREYARLIARVEDREQSAVVVEMPHIKPRSIAAAWRLYVKGPRWKALRTVSQHGQSGVAERFIASEVAAGHGVRWGDMPVDALARRHIKQIIAERMETPHAAAHTLRFLRKVVEVGLDEEWITVDPTYKVQVPTTTIGHRAWTADERARFEARWPSGSTPRLIYALALWTGTRRADLVKITWGNVEGGVLRISHGKTGARMALQILPPLAIELAQAKRHGETVLALPDGTPRSDKSLTGDIAKWTAAAGLSGCVVHGLRTTFIQMVDEASGSLRDTQFAAGHENHQTTEGYARDRERRDSMNRAMTALQRSLIKAV